MTPVALSAASTGVSPFWFATRAFGVVALVLLTATVILGIAGTARFATPGLPRVVTAGLHRNLSLLVLALVAMHVLTTIADGYAHIGLASAVVPFNSAYRGLWLGLGTVAFDMLLAVAATSLLRDRLPYRTWRGMHWLAYACWPIALWHSLGTGTDSKLPWLLALDGLCVASVAGAVGGRLSLAAPGRGRTAAITGSVLLPLATGIFVYAGPLQPHWAERAGTPAALLHTAASPGPAGGTLPATVPGPVAFAGRARKTAGPGHDSVTVTVNARVSGSPPRALTIVLRGAPDDAGIDMASGSVRLTTAGHGASARGPVTVLRGHRLTAILHSQGGRQQEADLTLMVTGRNATGRLTLRSWSGA
jgi:methionine sulfoxide reductase heme-binding subunit